MTSEQKEYVFQIADEIRRTEAGSRYKVFASMTIIRIQDTWDESNYRMLCVCENDTKLTLRRKMMGLVMEMTEEKKK